MLPNIIIVMVVVAFCTLVGGIYNGEKLFKAILFSVLCSVIAGASVCLLGILIDMPLIRAS